jgi:2-dehydro-3-deoxygalactonokinase
MTRLVAIDWGSTTLRGALLDADGVVREERTAARGMLSVAPGGFAEVFAQHFGDWMSAPGTRCLMAGMVGSKQGWVEAAYCACPAGVEEIAAHLTRLDPSALARVRDIAIVPGVRCERDGVPDVMRGEEVQIFGAMRLAGLTDGLFVLPGTHSKWATVQDGRITGFRTFMTGEFYGLLSQHSILARTLEADAALDEAVFLRGVTRAGDGEGLLHNAFGVRALGLFGRLSPAQSASYLSGLLIGEELRLQELPVDREVIAIGATALTARYALALKLRGTSVRSFGAEATWAGLRALQR